MWGSLLPKMLLPARATSNERLGAVGLPHCQGFCQLSHLGDPASLLWVRLWPPLFILPRLLSWVQLLLSHGKNISWLLD